MNEWCSQRRASLRAQRSNLSIGKAVNLQKEKTICIRKRQQIKQIEQIRSEANNLLDQLNLLFDVGQQIKQIEQIRSEANNLLDQLNLLFDLTLNLPAKPVSVFCFQFSVFPDGFPLARE